MRKITADYIYTLEGEPINNGLILADDKGKIISVSKSHSFEESELEKYEGAIVPGFVNTHCHVELSHLHKQFNEGEGLVSFIKQVMANRNTDTHLQEKAAIKANELMWNNGIVAVGDICNTNITVKLKETSKIKYHNFIELIGIDSNKTEQVMKEGKLLKRQFTGPTSLTPHAPYTVSLSLLKELKLYSSLQDNIISLHNQESQEENYFYRYKTGEFVELYKHLGVDISDFKSRSKTSLAALLPVLPKKQKKLLVHNTFTSQNDIFLANRISQDIYWCFCPNANWFIERQFPNLKLFLQSKFKFTLGTDSLASNKTLCIFEEMKTVLHYFPKFTFDEVLKWATINGAEFLGFDKHIGTIKAGKTPGLNHISEFYDGSITPKSSLKKII